MIAWRCSLENNCSDRCSSENLLAFLSSAEGYTNSNERGLSSSIGISSSAAMFVVLACNGERMMLLLEETLVSLDLPLPLTEPCSTRVEVDEGCSSCRWCKLPFGLKQYISLEAPCSSSSQESYLAIGEMRPWRLFVFGSGAARAATFSTLPLKVNESRDCTSASSGIF